MIIHSPWYKEVTASNILRYSSTFFHYLPLYQPLFYYIFSLSHLLEKCSIDY